MEKAIIPTRSSGSDELSNVTTINDSASYSQLNYDTSYQSARCCTTLDAGIWSGLYSKDLELHTARNANMMSKHHELEASNRTILLDWLMEICELYRVSRDTYYLALDYLDRFLSKSTEIKRAELQLVGITCLFIAGKVEEVKYISVVDLIRLTDSLYTTEEVFEMEKKMLETIGWRTTIWTANRWLIAYLHVIQRSINPQEFMQLTELLDIATLDIESLQYSYSVLAAACINSTLSDTLGLIKHSQINVLNVFECTSWIKQFWDVVKKKPLIQPPKLSATILQNYRCKILNYSVHQLYDNILEYYNTAKGSYKKHEEQNNSD